MTEPRKVDWRKLAQAAFERIHPTQRNIVTTLATEPRPWAPTDLADLLDESLSGLSYHVRALARAGWIVEREDLRENVRGALKHYYEIAPEFMAAAEPAAA